MKLKFKKVLEIILNSGDKYEIELPDEYINSLSDGEAEGTANLENITYPIYLTLNGEKIKVEESDVKSINVNHKISNNIPRL